jgi:predicted nucleic acid-binding protein
MRRLVKPRLYVETTVWNFVFATDAPEKREITQTFFRQVRRGLFELYVSDVVIAELQAASEPKRSQLLNLVDEVGPIGLRTSDEAESLAAEFIAEGMVPEKYGDDALHIAIALTEGMDALLSWNFKHIVKLKTRLMVAKVCRRAGYKPVQISNPGEVGYDDKA